MNTPIGTVSALFDALGGPARVGRILERGNSTASEMKRRGSIPVDYWPALIASDEGKAIGLTPDDLMRLHTASGLQAIEAAE